MPVAEERPPTGPLGSSIIATSRCGSGVCSAIHQMQEVSLTNSWHSGTMFCTAYQHIWFYPPTGDVGPQ